MKSKHNNISLIVETSWEVCNKVGGIYTVLSTKAKTMEELYPGKVVFIGPDVWTRDTPCPCFSEESTPLDAWRDAVMLPEGVSVRVGRWEIPGRPMAVLVKFDGMYAVKDAFYGEMWKEFGVDSLHAYGDYDEGCAFAHAAGIVAESLFCNFGLDKKPGGIAHFDEWTTGMGLLYVKSKLPSVGTVFTTHATCIGRSICGNGKPLYDQLKNYNGDQMARELNMESKHSLEKAAAHAADVFTTVSRITADECEQLLERRPDVVTPNGFEGDFVPAGNAYAPKRRAARNLLLRVASALTGVKYDNDTFIVATSGRCEYRNKGLGVFLDAMAGLRGRTASHRVLAFVMVPAWCAGPRADLRDAIDDRAVTRLPEPVLTHWLNNPDQDAVLSRIRSLGFDSISDKVDVVYVPCYLNGADGIFDRTYYELLIGVDATVFASYYEPWGYTPLESVAFGIPTVTTSLSGFGSWVLATLTNGFASSGVDVVKRNDSNYGEVVTCITDTLLSLMTSDAKSRTAVRNAARATAARADWSEFMPFYVEAYDLAESKAAARLAH
ncbi:MAG: glycogen/starch synthase [Muribaculaceae bacterium]|nr:glycogen/starch synthase [Muribaculaceae bacterium]